MLGSLFHCAWIASITQRALCAITTFARLDDRHTWINAERKTFLLAAESVLKPPKARARGEAIAAAGVAWGPSSAVPTRRGYRCQSCSLDALGHAFMTLYIKTVMYRTLVHVNE